MSVLDNLSQEQRHKNIKNIRSHDTKIEVILRRALWNKGYRYRKNYKQLPGKPDIVLTKYRIAIFCDGEFFHGKDWEVLNQDWRKVITVNFGLVRYPGTGKGMMKLTRDCCLKDGLLYGFGAMI